MPEDKGVHALRGNRKIIRPRVLQVVVMSAYATCGIVSVTWILESRGSDAVTVMITGSSVTGMIGSNESNQVHCYAIVILQHIRTKPLYNIGDTTQLHGYMIYNNELKSTVILHESCSSLEVE